VLILSRSGSGGGDRRARAGDPNCLHIPGLEVRNGSTYTLVVSDKDDLDAVLPASVVTSLKARARARGLLPVSGGCGDAAVCKEFKMCGENKSAPEIQHDCFWRRALLSLFAHWSCGWRQYSVTASACRAALSQQCAALDQSAGDAESGCTQRCVQSWSTIVLLEPTAK